MHSLNTHQDGNGAQKQPFEYKKRAENGMILEIHHTVLGDKGEIRRIKFSSAAINYNEDQIIASDRKGNVFVIDLKTRQLWTLPILGKVTAIAFSPNVKSVILTAGKDANIYVRNIEDFTMVAVMKEHADKIIDFSFDADYFCLSYSKTEAIIWDLQTYEKVHKLTLRSNTNIKQAMFLPVLNNIIACFEDNVIHVWNHDTFEFNKKISAFNSKITNVKCLTCTKDGKILAITGASETIAIYKTETWEPLKQITLPNNINIENATFIPQTFDLGSNKILALLTRDYEIHTINIESCMYLQKVETNSAIRFMSSENGKFLCCLTKMGEINVYNVKQLFRKCKSAPFPLPHDNSLKFTRSCMDLKQEEAGSSKLINSASKSSISQTSLLRKENRLREIQNELKKTLSLKKLKPILQQYQQYPDKHRNLIWRYLLKLPNNVDLYKSLANRGIHKNFLNLDKIYPMRSIRSMRNLKTTLSALAYWCPLFSQVQYLPLFIFPFIKLFENNALVTFEVVYTILVNYCQFWFEYYPLPPINILLIIENVLTEHCPVLLQHYYKLEVTTQIYAWPLLENGFSEVLDDAQWCVLWDNVLTNEPAFLLLAVVAYNIVQKNVLMQFSTKENILEYLHTQNHVDMKLFVGTIYKLTQNTSDENHPRCFLNEFKALPVDTYTVFSGYPKVFVEYQADKLEKIEQEERDILQQEIEALEKIREQQDKIKEGISKQEHAKRLEALEWKCKRLIQDEEKRLMEKRSGMLDIQRDVTSSERILNSEDDVRKRLDDLNANRRAFEMWKMRENNDRQKKRNDKSRTNREISDGENLRLRYSRLMERQMSLEARLNQVRTENSNQSFASLTSSSVDSASRLKVVRDLLNEAEHELSKLVPTSKRTGSDLSKDRSSLSNKTTKAKELEEAFANMLRIYQT